MSRNPAGPSLLPSVLDRLLDDDPDNSRDPPEEPHQQMRALKAAVCRDLENLLNTRVRNHTWPPNLRQLTVSLVNYGMVDFTNASLASGTDREGFCQLIREAIHRYEPRLKNVSVVPVPTADPADRTFHFRIEAMLRTEPAPEPVVFDSDIEPGTGEVEVRGVAS
jgi:type VI secretion system protein ImpF